MTKSYKKISKCLISPVEYDHSIDSYVLICIAEDGELLNFILDDFLASRLIARNYLYHYFATYCDVSYFDVYGLELDNIYLRDSTYLRPNHSCAIL